MSYRHFDRHPDAIDFPFGFGLSYTSFAVSNVTISETKLGKNGDMTVRAEVSNTGSVAGSEVVQVYVGGPSEGPTISIDCPRSSLPGSPKSPWNRARRLTLPSQSTRSMLLTGLKNRTKGSSRLEFTRS